MASLAGKMVMANKLKNMKPFDHYARIAGGVEAGLLALLGIVGLAVAPAHAKWAGGYCLVLSIFVFCVQALQLPVWVKRPNVGALDKVHNFLQKYHFRGGVYVLLGFPALGSDATIFAALVLMIVGGLYFLAHYKFGLVGEMIEDGHEQLQNKENLRSDETPKSKKGAKDSFGGSAEDDRSLGLPPKEVGGIAQPSPANGKPAASPAKGAGSRGLDDDDDAFATKGGKGGDEETGGAGGDEGAGAGKGKFKFGMKNPVKGFKFPGGGKKAGGGGTHEDDMHV